MAPKIYPDQKDFQPLRLAAKSSLMHLIDLAAYFHRIGYNGDTTPDLATLSALHLAHISTFVFENLENWNGRAPSLDLAAIEDKFVRRKRGGYCFEQNALFAAVLAQLGYEVKPRIGWVQWMQPPGSRPTRSHMFLQVDLEGRTWIVDVGFGSIGQTAPLALDTTAVQFTPHESRRFVFENGVTTHQVEIAPDQWENVYSFDDVIPFPMDFEVSNWYIATYPGTLFRQSVLATLPRKDHRISFAFGQFTRRFLDGRTEKRDITGDSELRDLLIREFGLPAAEADVMNSGFTPAPISCTS